MTRFIIILVALVLVGPMAASARDADRATGFYAGTLGGKLAVTMSLRQYGDKIEGYYHYDKNNVDIRLAGEVGPDGEVTLSEFGYFETTGTWKGIVGDDGLFSGRWISGNGKRSADFSLEPVSLKGNPGKPIGKKVAFGAVEMDIPREKTRLPKALAVKLVDQMVQSGELDTEPGGDLAAMVKKDPSGLFMAEMIDLDNDGTPELAVQTSGEVGACTSQNCSFWMFRKQGGSYVEILADMVGYSGYSALNQSGSGFADLAVSQHASAADTVFAIFHFDGKAYRPATCITKHYRDEENFTYSETGCQQ